MNRSCLLVLLLGLFIGRLEGFSSVSSRIRSSDLKWRQQSRSSDHPIIPRTRTSAGRPLQISFFDLIVNDGNSDRYEEEEEDRYEMALFALALVPPMLGFFLWEDIAKGVAFLFDNFNTYSRNVDGNAFASEILRPTINGIVVPALSIVLGTLFATTVNVLWNRQLRMRTSINKEVGELRLLRRALFGCFGTAQHSKRRALSLTLLHHYTDTLVKELQPGCIGWLEDVQRNGGISINEMDELSDMLHGVDGAAASRQSSVSTAIDILKSLNAHRSERVATTLQFFPSIHWVLLFVLYASINIAFFIDSNQGVLQYLNSLQLKVLFSVLVGVGSGASVLLVGLEDPFRGPFSIQLEAMQLSSFENLLLEDVQTAEAESESVGYSARLTLNRNNKRPNYNTGNTIMFHLLTGPWATPARYFGDLIAWMYKKGWHLVSVVKRSILRHSSSRRRRRLSESSSRKKGKLYYWGSET